MAGKDFDKKITQTSKGDEREFKGSGIEGKKSAPGDSKNKQTNKDKEELKNAGT